MRRSRRTRKLIPALVAAALLTGAGATALPSHSGSAHWYVHTTTAAHWFGKGPHGGA